MVMRWDVLNRLADLIGARRYLEIGVADGTTMRQVAVPEKWGVDPYPQVEAVKAADVFVAKTSKEFFRLMNGRVKFDLVFIDGEHRAETVYAEVQDSLLNLSPGGVIVLHDCNPVTEEMQSLPQTQLEWTGDVWKAVVRLRREGYLLQVIDADYGIGVLVDTGGLKKNYLSAEPFQALGWQELQADRAAFLGLVSAERWQSMVVDAFSVAMRQRWSAP